MKTSALVLTDANFDSTTQSGLILVDFWAPRCGPCRQQIPILERVAVAMAEKAAVGKCNVDEEPRTAERFGVRKIPTLVILKDTREVERFVGLQPEAALIAVLRKHLGGAVDGEHAKR